MKKFPLLFVLILLVFVSLTACSGKKSEVTSEELSVMSSEESVSSEQTEPEEVYRSIYDGREIHKDLVGLRPMMVMIDNQPRARDQANLTKASVIWEMRVEGEFTRYMALFEQKPGKNDFLVGPIRSARPNFVTIANQYGAIYAHHGGSGDGLSLVRNLGLDNLDALADDGSLFIRYRKTGKRPPHDSYFNLASAFERAKDLGFAMDIEGGGRGFAFHEDFQPLDQGEPARSFFLNYQGKLNNVEFKYNSEKKAYERYREGVLQVDEGSGEPVLSTNVIIQYADSYIYDNGGHRAFNSVGEGKGFYATGGSYIPIQWKKADDHTTPTTFYTESGQELVLNPGLTWISAIDERMDPEFK